MAQVSEAQYNNRAASELRKRKVAKLFEIAEKYGVIKRGWSCIDYMRYAVKNYGWESTCVSGAKGQAKSNLLLQHGFAIYKNMDTVRKYTVTKRKDLLDHMEYAINNEIRIPWIGVDDIAALFPKSLYFTHRKLYSKLQASWEIVRTVMNCFEFTCTLKRKVAGFVMEDITGDIKCYNRIGDLKSHYDYRRWLWLRNLKDPTSDIAKLISVEDIPFPLTPDAYKIDNELCNGRFFSGGKEYIGMDFFENHACLCGVSREDFKKYWDNRLDLAKTSFKDFKDIFEEPQPKTKQVPLATEPLSEETNTALAREASNVARQMGITSGIKRRALKARLAEMQAENDKLRAESAQREQESKN